MVLTATANAVGSTSATAQSSLLISFRELCHSLEAFNPTESKVTLRSQLRDATPAFRSCGESFPSSLSSGKAKASAESVTLTSGRVVRFEEQQKELHRSISQLHKIDEKEVAVLLQVFFDSDDSNLELLSTSTDAFRSPLQQKPTARRKRGHLGVAKGAEDLTTKFFDSFTAFYFEEKLYILRCISALIRIADDSFHELNDIAKEVLNEFADQSFAIKCLARFQHLCQEELVEDIREVPRYSVFWSKHGLREQLALLEVVFLLYYSRLDATALVIKSIIDVVRSTDFGKEQANFGFFDSEGGQLADCVGNFLVLLTVESLELEKCMEGLDLHSPARESPQVDGEAILIECPDILGDIMDFLQTTTQADHLRGPLLISFALLLSRIDSALIEWQAARPTEPYPTHLKALQESLQKRGGVGALWPDFVSAALTPDLNLFGTMNTILTSPLFRSDTQVSSIFSLAISSSLALRAVVKGFLLSITQLIRPEFIQDYHGLINLWRNTFSSHDTDIVRAINGNSDSTAALCAQFWETDFDIEARRAVLNMANRRFPVSFCPLLRLCQALAGESCIADERSMRASTAVLGYLAQMSTVTQVMPAPPSSLSLPYEIVDASSSSSGVSFRATRAISVFGSHLVVPTGTLGRLVSPPNQAPVVIVWELTGVGYSAWRLLKDVLASFVGLLDVTSPWKASARQDSDAAVFNDKDPVANFSTLAPEEATQYDGEVVADILSLFCAILSGGRYLSATLLSHLNGDDVGVVEPCQPTALSSKSNLVEIVLRILDQSLNNPNVASKVIASSLRLLTLLVPSTSSPIWQVMRSSNALVGSSGMVPFSTQSSAFKASSTSLLSHEVSAGEFTGLLKLLDLHHALLVDLQKTQYSSSVEALQTKADVVSRAAHFILYQVWSEYQNWKYVSIRQQTEIGIKCVSFFHEVCRDKSLRASPSTKTLLRLIQDCFLFSAAPSLIFAPLLRTLVNGQRFINTLQRQMRQVEVELARKLLLCSLQFALTIMQEQDLFELLDSPVASPGVFESMVFDRNAKGLGDVVKAIAANTLMQNAAVINKEAVKLMTSLCRSTVKLQTSQAPTLIGHLGSLSEVEKLVNGLVEAVESSDRDESLLVQVWNLLSAIVETQPALTTLLLTGGHLAASFERQLASSEGDKKAAPSASDSPKTKSATEVAKSIVMKWQEVLSAPSVQRIGILEGALKFLNTAWKHALEHRDVFTKLRSDQAFWSSVSQLAQAEATDLSLPSSTSNEKGDGEGGKSDASGPVCRFALTRMCSARALELLTCDVELDHLSTKKSKASSNAARLSFDRVMGILTKSSVLLPTLQAAVRFPCDTLTHTDVLSRLAQTFPEMSMDDFRMTARRDDFDYTRPFGDGYLFDIDLLQVKLQGFAPSVEEELEGQDEAQSAALQQALLLVVGLNLDWSIIDAQGTYLNAWTNIVKVMIELAPHHDKQTVKTMQNVALGAWIACAKITASEDVESEVTIGIHTQRVTLLSVLLKLSWKEETIDGNGDVAQNNEQTRETMDLVEQLLTHPLFRVEDGIRNRASYPRQVFEMVYLSARYYCQVFAKGQERKGEAVEGAVESTRELQQSAETFLLVSITCLRTVIDNAWSALSLQGGDNGNENMIGEADEDINLLTSILDVLLSPACAISPHTWAPRFQTTSVLSSAIDLFSRSPLQQRPTQLSSEEILASGVTPIYSESLLTLFFNLSTNRQTAELLVSSGVTNGLCNNALGSVMDSSQDCIPPRLANTSFENPSHSCWVQMLRIVVSCICHLDAKESARFTKTEAWSFFKVYERKLNQSLEVRFRAKSGLMSNRRGAEGGVAQGESIRINQLEEVDLILQLYLYIIRAKVNIHAQEQQQQQQQRQLEDGGGGKDSHDHDLFGSYTSKASRQLQEFVHLLQHPRELTALVESRAEGREDEARVRLLLTTSCSSIVSSFWEIGRGGQVLCSEPSEWGAVRTIILPTIGTSPTTSSSTGTLLDLATYLIDTILRLSSPSSSSSSSSLLDKKDQVLFLQSTLEQTAALCITQVVSAAYTRTNSYSSPTRKDLETGLGREVKQVLQTSEATTSFMDMLLTFHNRWLQGGND
ncbi:hypothetical protein CBS101457_004717 [Exobasidium rhododendri]|nr:hypothetical protein CBS101457_004717 [Exobasidium rhododendri]